MFAYLLHAPNTPSDAQTDDFFRRFTETPGLINAYQMVRADDPSDAVVVAIWESREAAERYLNAAPLREEVDEAIPQVKRVMYEVTGHK